MLPERHHLKKEADARLEGLPAPRPINSRFFRSAAQQASVAPLGNFARATLPVTVAEELAPEPVEEPLACRVVGVAALGRYRARVLALRADDEFFN